MAVTAHFFDNCIANAFGSTTAGNAPNIDILSDDIYCALLGNALPVRATDDFWDDVVGDELANGNGYTTNGVLFSAKTFGIASNVIKFDNTVDTAWTSATFSAYYAVIYDRTPATDATRPLIGFVDFGGAASPSNGTLTIAWSTSGIFTITNS